VFDFKLAGRKVTSSNEPGPTFVGYASIPGLENATFEPVEEQPSQSSDGEDEATPSPKPSAKTAGHRSKSKQTRKRSSNDQSGD
jgi:hypothetical protein